MKWMLLALLLASRLAFAAPLHRGEAWTALALNDQHDKPLAVGADIRVVFFAFEMDGARLMTKVLDGLPAATLHEKNAGYIADISSMPGLISTMAAEPRMQAAPYRIALVRFARDGERLPRKPGAVTVLRVDGGRISSIDFARDAQQIGIHLK
jgi:hypothetical protein